MNKMFLILHFILLFSFSSCQKTADQALSTTTEISYTFPEESEPHEGTWLQWPHHYQYGMDFRDDLDPTWVAITKELISSEKVHIVAYNEVEKSRIINLLKQDGIDLTNVDFSLYPTDDFWVRDNGPIYVHDEKGNLIIQDWGFNGWGEKADFSKCNTIPAKIARDQDRTVVNLNDLMINEGGSVEVDGNGSLLACKSSILNNNRNPGMTLAQAEEIFTKYYGATHFVWLDGQAGFDITDQHIDGFARFGNSTTIVTMEKEDLLYYDVKPSDIDRLYAAKNKDGVPYTLVKVPLTRNDVITTYGKNVGKGSYCNYYIANTKVLVPIYNDPNDALALEKIQSLYPDRTVVGIDSRNVYANGGMIHCVTQQQPLE
jgi:agmatine deiminase